MFLRTILNTAHRMVYPFLSVFARGLGVDISTMSLLMTVRSLLGTTSPLFAPLADRRGRKFGMLAGISIFTLGVGLVQFTHPFWTLSPRFFLGWSANTCSTPPCKPISETASHTNSAAQH